MKSLFEKDAAQDICNRIKNLSATSQRQWGKMDIAQMLAHCSATMETATGQKRPPRTFIARIVGPMVKSSFLGPKPFPKNSPTDKSFLIKDQRNFDAEKERLLILVKQFAEGGEAKCTTHPHAFFGKLTPTEWATSMYKHLDHHLIQFGA
jgi:hypothetical protein